MIWPPAQNRRRWALGAMAGNRRSLAAGIRVRGGPKGRIINRPGPKVTGRGLSDKTSEEVSGRCPRRRERLTRPAESTSASCETARRRALESDAESTGKDDLLNGLVGSRLIQVINELLRVVGVDDMFESGCGVEKVPLQ